MNKELLLESCTTLIAMLLILLGLNYYAFKDLDMGKQVKSVEDISELSKAYNEKLEFVKADIAVCTAKDNSKKPYTRYNCNTYIVVKNEKGKYINVRLDGNYDYLKGLQGMLQEPKNYYKRSQSFFKWLENAGYED